jgi:hypothetical protein
MRLIDVMDELGVALKAIPDLRVKPYTEKRVNPPQAVVALPRRYSYDSTMGRGSDDIELSIVVFVGVSDAESSRNAIGDYVDGAGNRSVKKAIEAHIPAGDAYDVAHVMAAEFLIMSVAGVEYQTATFRVRVVGKGII